jgi:membrane protein required for colicin V production
MISSFIYSIYKGFVSEVFSLLSILFASIVATRYCYLGEVYLKELIESKNVTYTIGFILLFLITAVLIRMLGLPINSFIVKTMGMSASNRLFGGLLGLIKGVILASVLLLTLNTFSKNGSETISKTRWAHHFLPISEFIADFLPQGLLKNSKRDYRKIRSLLEEGKRKSRENIYNAIEEDKKKLREILEKNL